MVIAKAGGDTVIHHHAIILQHQPIAAFAYAELEPAVGVEPVQEFGRVRALNVDLAEGRGVEEAGASRAARTSRSTASCIVSPSCG